MNPNPIHRFTPLRDESLTGFTDSPIRPKLIYIAGPYTAENTYSLRRNILKAEAAAREVMKHGFVPVIPHSLGDALDTGSKFKHFQHHDWMQKLCLPLLSRCDGLLLIEGWQNSKGSRIEFDFAQTNNMPIFYKPERIRF